MSDLSDYKLVPKATGTSNVTVSNAVIANIANTANTVAYANVTGKPNQSLDTTSDVTFHNLHVTGTETITNTSVQNITDNKITLNSGATGTPTLNASIVVGRGSSSNTALRWNESTQKWEQTRDGGTYINIPINTTELTEGTNLYFTTARANTAFDNRLSAKTTDNLIEGSTNLYFTTDRANTAFDNRLAIKTTDNVTEGSTNKYFTNARARTAISVTGSGSYDNTTGVITVTGGVTSVNTKTGAVTLSTTDISEGTNLYYTDVRSNTAFDARLAVKTTTNLTEGTNLYYTTDRANTAMAAFTGNLTSGNANLGNLTKSNYFSGNGSLLTSITGGNVSGNVNYAITSNWSNVANSITGTNVSGNVNYAITSNWANTANAITGTNVSGNVNYAITSNWANTANAVTWTNISSKPTTISGYGITDTFYSNSNTSAYLPTYTGNLTSGNASLGNLLVANYHSGNGSLLSSITGANVTGWVANANNANYLGGVVATSYLQTTGTGSGLTSITGANVTGQVGNATIAGTVYTNTQPNITSTGTLTSLNVTGTITGGNLTSNAEIAGYGALTLGNIANATATKTRIVTAGTTSYIQTGNGTAGSTGNIVFSPTLDATARVTINTTSGDLTATGNITGANLIAGSSGQGNVYAGNVIVNGQPTTYGTVNPDYIQVEKSADQTFVAKNADINFNVTTATNGGIAYASNIFTLTAGKTYLLEATLCTNTFTSTGAFIWYSWVDATTNAQLDTSNGAATSTGSSGVSVPATWTANDNYSSSARLIYTPNTNQTVKLRATDGSGTCTVLAIGTRATIKQLNPKIAIQATATGTVNNQYSSVTLTSNQVIGSPGTPTNIVFQSATGTVPYNTSTGVWTLTSGVTYNLTAVLAVTGASNYLGYQWVDSVSGTALSTALGFATLATTQVSSVPLSIVYTPNTNQTIVLRNVNGQYASVIANYSWATVTQINQAFALNTLDTMTTTGNVTVGGNLTVTGGIRKSARVLTTTTTLTVADASGFIEFAGSGTYTVTLPDPTQAANSGIGYRFWQNTSQNITLSTPAGNFYGPSGSSASTKVLAQATTQYWDVWSDGYNWAVFGIKTV